MCFQIRKQSEDLPLEEVKEMFKALRSTGVHYLHLTGGEPLIRKDIVEIVKFAKGLGFHVSLNTSCADPHGHIYDVTEVLDTLIISFDGMKEIHDSNRGEGAFDRCLEVIQGIRERKQKVNITANMCYGDKNMQDIRPITELVKELKVKIKIYPIYVEQRYATQSDYAFLPSRETVVQVAEQLSKWKENNKYIMMSDSVLDFFKKKKRHKRYSCENFQIRISPKGGIKRCSLVNNKDAVYFDYNRPEEFMKVVRSMPQFMCSEPMMCCTEISNVLNFNFKSSFETFKKFTNS